jgi:hypothetical protein
MGKGAGQHFVDDLLARSAKLESFVREAMVDCSAGTGDSLDQAPFDHPHCQRPEGLIGLEGQLGEIVQRCLGILVEMSQRVPLHQTHREGDESGGDGTVVSHLQPLYGEADLL